MKDKILSIQSKVVYGYVGNNIAELAIQLHGLDVISFPTVYLSAHTGHRPIHGKAVSKDLFDDLIDGIEAIDVLDTTSCVVTGYIGSEDILLSSSEFIQRIKKTFPHKLYICDPVMGDISTGLYVPDTVAGQLISTLIPYCDILTPNQFELEYILKHKVNTIAEIIDLVKLNLILSKKTIVATGCHLEDTPEGQIETIIIRGEDTERIYSQNIDIDAVGTGDLFTAIFASQLTKGKDLVSAVAKASATISEVLAYITRRGLDEMNAECLLRYIRE